MPLVQLRVLQRHGDIACQSADQVPVGTGEGGAPELFGHDQHAHQFVARCQRGGDDLFGWQVEVGKLRF